MLNIRVKIKAWADVDELAEKAWRCWTRAASVWTAALSRCNAMLTKRACLLAVSASQHWCVWSCNKASDYMEYDVRVLKRRSAKMFVCSSKTFVFKIQFRFSLIKQTLGLSGRMWFSSGVIVAATQTLAVRFRLLNTRWERCFSSGCPLRRFLNWVKWGWCHVKNVLHMQRLQANRCYFKLTQQLNARSKESSQMNRVARFPQQNLLPKTSPIAFRIAKIGFQG